MCILALISSEFGAVQDKKSNGACENLSPKMVQNSCSQKQSPRLEANTKGSEAVMGEDLPSDTSFGTKRSADGPSAPSQSKKICITSEAIDFRARSDWVSSLTESEQDTVKMLLDGQSELLPGSNFLPVSATSNASLQRALDLHQRCANVQWLKVPELRAEGCC